MRRILEALFARNGGVVDLACAGETSWHGFATAIVAGLKSRGVKSRCGDDHPDCDGRFPDQGQSGPVIPGSTCRDAEIVSGLTTPAWQEALSAELDSLVARQREQAVCGEHSVLPL